MGDFDDLGPRSDRGLELIDDVLLRWRWQLDGDLLHHDAVAPDPLVPGGQHPAVILIGDDHLVAGLEVEAENHRLIGLGGVPDNRHLLGIAAEALRQIAPDTLDPGLEGLPHVDDRELIRKTEIPDHLLEHMGRRRAAAAVVEIHHGAVAVERPLNLSPVVLVVSASHGGTHIRLQGPADRISPHHGQSRGPRHRSHKTPATRH